MVTEQLLGSYSLPLNAETRKKVTAVASPETRLALARAYPLTKTLARILPVLLLAKPHPAVGSRPDRSLQMKKFSSVRRGVTARCYFHGQDYGALRT